MIDMPTPEDIQKAAALGLNEQDLLDMERDEKLFQEGKDSHTMKIYEDAERMRATDAANPYHKSMRLMDKPKRVKKPLASNERDYKERDFQREFNRWFHHNRHRFSTSCFIELKATPGDSIPFDVVRPSQHAALQACTTDAGVYHQIESDPYKEQSAKPADSVFVRNGKGFLAVMFQCKQRGNRLFYMIPYPSWLTEQAKGDRKSLTEDAAARIGVRCEL